MFNPWLPGPQVSDLSIHLTVAAIGLVLFFTTISLFFKKKSLETAPFPAVATIYRIEQLNEELTVDKNEFKKYLKWSPVKIMYNHVHIGDIVDFISFQNKVLTVYVSFSQTKEGKKARDLYMKDKISLTIVPVIGVTPDENAGHITRILRIKHALFKEN